MFEDRDEYENPDCGTTDADMADLASWIKKKNALKEQAQEKILDQPETSSEEN